MVRHLIPNRASYSRYFHREEDDDELLENLFTTYRHVRAGNWDEVVMLFDDYFQRVHVAVLNMLGETILHLAISHGPDDIVKKLVDIISVKDPEHKRALKVENEEGNTPLHLAAATGSLTMCVCIAEADPSLGIGRNKMGESPLFLAALRGKTDIFVCLYSICYKHLDNSYYRRKGGETILHCAIKRECLGEQHIFVETYKLMFNYFYFWFEKTTMRYLVKGNCCTGTIKFTAILLQLA